MKVNITDPASYDGWYYSRRGQWIAQREMSLVTELMQPQAGESLLDVGCGTGYFSRQFRKQGLEVTALEPDSRMLAFARTSDKTIHWLAGRAEDLPFESNSFDHVAAITSLCFTDKPQQALDEMWRVARKTVGLGLLNRHSLLYLKKQGRGAYKGARWDSCKDIRIMLNKLQPEPLRTGCKSAVFFPGGNSGARLMEYILPAGLKLGGFLAAGLEKQP